MYLDIEILDIKEQLIMSPTPSLRGYPVDPAMQRLAARQSHNRRMRRARRRLTARIFLAGRIWGAQRRIRSAEGGLGASGEVCRQA